MHYYGQWPDKNFLMVEDAAEFIGLRLCKWGRISVMQYKEKYGTVRVYCHFGWSSFYSIWRPRYFWVSKYWPYRADLAISRFVMPILNKLIIPLQMRWYKYVYFTAVKRWPKIEREILCAADYPELLER